MSTSNPVEVSVGEEVRRHGRPITTTFGAFVVFGRGLLAVLFFGILALAGPDGMQDVLKEFEVKDPDAASLAQPVWIATMVVGAIVVLTSFLLGVLVLRGVNWARITLLLYATLSIGLQFGAGGPATRKSGSALPSRSRLWISCPCWLCQGSRLVSTRGSVREVVATAVRPQCVPR